VRIGVLDAGANTVQLVVVDGLAGGPPFPVVALKQRLRLGQHMDADGAIDADGIRGLVECVRLAADEAEQYGVDELHAIATAVIRDAANASDILATVCRETGVDLEVMPGEHEARLTFIAARRWFGWSAGSLLLLDIGGGSAEVAWGRTDEPSFAVSMPLGARQLTRELLHGDPPSRTAVEHLVEHVEHEVDSLSEELRFEIGATRPVATSRTFQQLARLCGAPPRRRGIFTARRLRGRDLHRWIPKLARMTIQERSQLPGISRTRARQTLAGAVVADLLMRKLGVDGVDVCPWALREGVVLCRLELLDRQAA